MSLITTAPARAVPTAETMQIGYFLSSEEWGPEELVSIAVKAQEAGFDRLWISDHYRPWNDEQGLR